MYNGNVSDPWALRTVRILQAAADPESSWIWIHTYGGLDVYVSDHYYQVHASGLGSVCDGDSLSSHHRVLEPGHTAPADRPMGFVKIPGKILSVHTLLQ